MVLRTVLILVLVVILFLVWVSRDMRIHPQLGGSGNRSFFTNIDRLWVCLGIHPSGRTGGLGWLVRNVKAEEVIKEDGETKRGIKDKTSWHVLERQ